MCGIFGCAAARDVTPLLLRGLRHLEYRGYDSAGVAVLQDGELKIVRREGRIDHLEAEVGQVGVHGTIGIGHTRWATHGPPTEKNAHPHRDGSGDIAVIHNGIIENHEVLRERLIGRGHRFVSDTDSEVLPHLIADYRRDMELTEAVSRALRDIQGTYAFVVLDRTRPDVLIGGRKDSPLVVGVGEAENYLASDVSALLELTRKVVYLENGEVVRISKDDITLLDKDGRVKDPRIETVAWDPESTARGGYRHFMLKEIEEQPAVVSRTLGRYLDGGRVALPLEGLGPDLASVRKITILACGTSWHAGLVGKFLIESRAGIPVDVDYASEFRYRDSLLAEGDLVIAISQSGETLDTLAAARYARESGARLLSVVNVQGSSLTRESDAVVLTDAGPEIGVASTKAFTTQLLALQLISLELSRSRGRLARDSEQAAIGDLRRLPLKMEECLASGDAVHRAAEQYWRRSDFLFLGRGINYPIALEGALKLKEISYIHAEGYPAGEMKHGPIALIDRKLPVVVIATPGRVHAKVLSNIQEVKARGGRVLAVACPGDEAVSKLADSLLPVPEVPEDLSPLLNVLPLQRLSYWIADLRGCDIDKPRNLAKSVTVE